MKADYQEIDEGEGYIGYREARQIIENHIQPLKAEIAALNQCAGRIVAADLVVRISYPSLNVSLKDGYAVKSADVALASAQNPKVLKIRGFAFAGHGFDGKVESGGAVCVCSGAPVPAGADAVVAAEFCEALEKQWHYSDAILTSGGAWGSHRDLIIDTMNRLGWQKLFHYVRMGPGKGVAFGLWRNRPFFCLPGGPSSNRMAFLQLALPAPTR
ncbi:MAG: molybdopterin-binding protein [Syntrophales bacterium]|nr:molybdopterin-binding protein [Syntrophales bacterium]